MDQNHETQIEIEAADVGPSVPTRRRKTADSEPGAVRVKLPEALGARVREVIAELKARGVNVTAEELLSSFWDRLPPIYFEDELLKRTPERFYIETAISMPEIREKLIRQARRSLRRLGVSDEESQQRPTRRGKKKADSVEAAAEGAVQE